ncbi:MAG TPA: hypothetical protein VMM79_15580 [Longimicrobiales bacterium]|nr:hypothetical protein [Longimicrobiales bacterium]
MRMNARASVMLVAAVWLAAAEPVAAQRGTPLEQATELAKTAKAAREPADRVATRIASTLRLGGEDVLRAIRAGGYRAEEAALATSAAL